MREVDQVHNAEDQRQAGGEQEQQQPELQTVQALFDEEKHQLDVISFRTSKKSEVKTLQAAFPPG
jgi:uncharacterized DUF497 family protein